MGEVKKDNLTEVFTFQPPNDAQKDAYSRIRASAMALGEVIVANTPRCADQQVALRKLRECVMTANASIALDGRI